MYAHTSLYTKLNIQFTYVLSALIKAKYRNPRLTAKWKIHTNSSGDNVFATPSTIALKVAQTISWWLFIRWQLVSIEIVMKTLPSIHYGYFLAWVRSGKARDKSVRPTGNKFTLHLICKHRWFSWKHSAVRNSFFINWFHSIAIIQVICHHDYDRNRCLGFFYDIQHSNMTLRVT